MSERTHISKAPSEKLIQATLKTFQCFYEQELTRSDAIEIIESLVSFSEELSELDNESESGLSKVTKAQNKSVQKLRKAKLIETDGITKSL